jgi:hypothetical protein
MRMAGIASLAAAYGSRLTAYLKHEALMQEAKNCPHCGHPVRQEMTVDTYAGICGASLLSYIGGVCAAHDRP